MRPRLLPPALLQHYMTDIASFNSFIATSMRRVACENSFLANFQPHCGSLRAFFPEPYPQNRETRHARHQDGEKKRNGRTSPCRPRATSAPDRNNHPHPQHWATTLQSSRRRCASATGCAIACAPRPPRQNRYRSTCNKPLGETRRLQTPIHYSSAQPPSEKTHLNCGAAYRRLHRLKQYPKRPSPGLDIRHHGLSLRASFPNDHGAGHPE